MPTLAISDLDAPWSHAYVIAVMLRPAASLEVHREIVSGMRAAGALEWRRTHDSASEYAKSVFWEAVGVRPFELQRDAREAYATQGRYSKGRMAGRILITALTAAGSGRRQLSLEGAYKTIYEGANNKIKGISRNSLREVWLEYQSVSHLWLAERCYPLSSGLRRGGELADFLALAETARVSGEQHRSQTGAGRLLTAGQMWTVPPVLQLPVWTISDGKITAG